MPLTDTEKKQLHTFVADCIFSEFNENNCEDVLDDYGPAARKLRADIQQDLNRVVSTMWALLEFRAHLIVIGLVDSANEFLKELERRSRSAA